ARLPPAAVCQFGARVGGCAGPWANAARQDTATRNDSLPPRWFAITANPVPIQLSFTVICSFCEICPSKYTKSLLRRTTYFKCGRSQFPGLVVGRESLGFRECRPTPLGA